MTGLVEQSEIRPEDHGEPDDSVDNDPKKFLESPSVIPPAARLCDGDILPAKGAIFGFIRSYIHLQN